MTNINQILDLDFSAVTDDFNWIASSGSNPQTIGGQLKIQPTQALSNFRRGIGVLDAGNDRVRVKSNLVISRPQSSTQDKINVIFGIYEGNNLVGEFNLCVENIAAGEMIEYNMDRIYSYSNLTSAVSLRLTFTEGWENEIHLEDLNIFDFKVNEDKRTYFIPGDLFELGLPAMSAAFDLKEYRVDNVETLTLDFFADNQNNGSNPLNDWKPAKAKLDGSNRVSDNTNTNTLNPFVSELGLNFDEINSFFGGKTLGSVNGKDYGMGILNIGLEKPEILDGLLMPRKGAFFLDIDYTKRLKVCFDVIVNTTNANVFTSPTYYRSYVIEWNPTTCEKQYYYFDRLTATPNQRIEADEEGFLFGLTGGSSSMVSIGCDEAFAFNGQSGVFEFEIDFGADTGQAGITYNAFDIPEKFEIEWNNQVFSSGFVGLSTYNQQLINNGVNVGEINTGNPGTGAGELKFNKDSATPSKATVRVTAPLQGTAWNISGICPSVVNFQAIDIAPGGCQTLVLPSQWMQVFVAVPNTQNYVPDTGDIIYTDQGLTTPFNGMGEDYRVRVPSGLATGVLNSVIGINNVGSVIRLITCSTTGGGSAISEISSNSSDCISNWRIAVAVPQGETRQVEISFNAAPSGQILGSTVGTTNISQTTAFDLGIDGAESGSPSQYQTCTITVTVRDGATVVSTKNFSRSHNNINC